MTPEQSTVSVRAPSAALPAAGVLVALVSVVLVGVQGAPTAPEPARGMPGPGAQGPPARFWLTLTQGSAGPARIALRGAGDSTFQQTVRLHPTRTSLPVARLSWSDASRPERRSTVADVTIRLDRLLHRRPPMELAFGWLTLDTAGAKAPSRSASMRRGRTGGRWSYVLRLDRAWPFGLALHVVVKRDAVPPRAATEGTLVTR
jgi:hypothetical protein